MRKVKVGEVFKAFKYVSFEDDGSVKFHTSKPVKLKGLGRFSGVMDSLVSVRLDPILRKQLWSEDTKWEDSLMEIDFSEGEEVESVFRVGDRVFMPKSLFSESCEGGEIIQVFDSMVRLTLDSEKSLVSVDVPTANVSFTPFDRVNGGFSQVRPAEEPKVGDVGFFWDINTGVEFTFGKLVKVEEGYYYSNHPRNVWDNFSKEAPEHIKQLIK